MTAMQDKAVLDAITFATPFGVFQADETGAVVDASGRWQVLLATDARRALGSGWLASIHPEDRERVALAWQAAVAGRVPFDIEFRVLPAQEGAEPGHVRVEARPAVWGEPPRPGYVGVAGDITRRKKVEQQLRLANRFLERSERLSGVGGWEADLIARTVKWTDQNCRIFDLEPGHQPGFDEHLKYFGEEAGPEIEKRARESAQTGEPWDVEVPMVTAKGRRVWVRSVGVVEFENGRPVRLAGALQDITDQQVSREALRQSEERQKRAMDASRLALWDLDLETGQGFLSENWSELIGGPRRVTVTTGGELMAAVPAHDQQRIAAALQAAVKGTADRYDVEHQIRRDDGKMIWIHSQGRVSKRDATGRALRAIGTNQDITARKLAELELARAAAITRATLDSTADGILVVSGEREILLVNRRLLDMMKIPPDMERLTRQSLGDLVVAQVKDPEAYSRRVLALYDTPAAESFDVLEFRDGRVFERHGRPLVLEGAATGRVWSFRDVTARTLADAEIKHAKEAAEAANRAKSDFLDTVSHEIRTPLNGVLGMTRLLLSESLQPQQRRYAELAHSSATSLLGLVNDVLDLGKIESGRMEFEHVQFSIADLAREIGDLFSLRAAEKGLTFDLRVDPRLPAAVIGDPGRLRQVLNNLLGNALKFTQAGLIGLDIHFAPGSDRRMMVGFTVHDTGIGVPLELQRDLFQRFFQADSSTTREYGGTGLGLAIVKQLCEQMGGRVSVQSEPGRGASFRCILPFAAVGERSDTPASVQTAGQEPREPRSQRILVAEDNSTNRIVVKGMLRNAGYADVTLVNDGQQVLDAIARERFDAVLMDCRMPVIDGYEATSRLRASGCKLPIIALTASASDEQRRKCLACGMNDFLSKPLDASQLAQVLDRWTAAPRPAVFAQEKALERLGGDGELMRQVLESFIEVAPRMIEQIRDGLQRGESADVYRQLHSLTGSASMVSAEALGQLCGELERHALGGRLDKVTAGMPALQSALDDFLAAGAAGLKDKTP